MGLAQEPTEEVRMTPAPIGADMAEADTIKCRGIRFPDDEDVLNPRIRRALKRRNYEKTEAEAVRPHVRPGDTVLELGGGIGFMSSIMSKGCGADHVHVYEPNPTLIPYMKEVHALNGIKNVTVNHAIVGPKKGTATFYQRENMLTSSLEENPKTIDSPIVATHEIEVHNINTVWTAIKPNVLVCDIEGAEADLFDKAKLTGLRLAVIEIHPQWIGEAGTRRVFDAMHRAGLTYFPKASQRKVVVFKKDW
ncbi:FkbM family methyltransferase [Maritimibacter dapengensis]|nr:FkbM family methyltransferase [Maritimibacter dapengensis]